MDKERHIDPAELAPTLRQIAERTWASFGFDPARLLQEIPRILGREPRDDEDFLIYLTDAGPLFPGQQLGYGAVPANAPRDLVLLTAAWELVQELMGTDGPEVLALQALENLVCVLEPFSRDGLDAVRACVTRPPPAGTIEINLRPDVPASLLSLLHAYDELAQRLGDARVVLASATYRSPHRKGPGRGAPRDVHLAMTAGFLHDHGFTWKEIVSLVVDDVGPGQEVKRMRQRVERHGMTRGKAAPWT